MVDAGLAAGLRALGMTPRRQRLTYSQQRRRAVISLSRGDLYDASPDLFNGMN